LRYSDPGEDFYDLLEGASLTVHDCNQTTFLETLESNIPTIVFFSEGDSPVRSSAQPYFDELESVGIYHKTPLSAAAAVKRHVENPSWWLAPGVQAARRSFVERFARRAPIRVIRKEMQACLDGIACSHR